MKKLLVISIMLFTIICFSTVSYSADWSIEVNKFGYASEDYSSLENDIPQIRVKRYFDQTYVFLSAERNELFMVGQSAWNIHLVGAGVGYEHAVTDKFSFFGDIGYYYPFYHQNGTEGQRYYMNAKVYGNAEGEYERFWEEYSVDDITGNFGLMLGAKYKFYKNFSMQAGYRYLNIDVLYLGESPSKGQVKDNQEAGWWQLKESQSYSGYFIGFSYDF